MEEYTPDKAREEQRNLQEDLEKLLRRYGDLESKINDYYSRVQGLHSMYEKREAEKSKYVSEWAERVNKSLSNIEEILAMGRERLDGISKDC